MFKKHYLFHRPVGNHPNDEPPGEDPKPDAGDKGGKTYSQAELDALFADRAKRAEEAALKKHFESLGVKDADELKALVEARKKADEAAKTEAQKAADALAKLETEVASKQAAADLKIAEMTKRLLDSEIKQAAGRPVTDKEGKVLRPAFHPEILDDIPLLITREGIQEKDGKYVGIEEALVTLAKAKPLLTTTGEPVSKDKGTPPKGPRKPVTPDGETAPKGPQYVKSL